MSPQQLLAGVNAEYEKLTKDELTNLGVVLGAYRSFRGNRRKHVAYVGMPITTGKRFYDVLSEHGVHTREELATLFGSRALFDLVIAPNVREGIALADQLGKRDDRLFIAPSVFEAKPWRWTDDAYMALWYRVIGELAGSHVVMDGWEYSTGGVREVLFSMFCQWRIIRNYTAMGAAREFGLENFTPVMDPSEKIRELEAMWAIRVFDASSNEITIDIALAKIVAAIEDLKTRGFEAKDLLAPVERMNAVLTLSPISLMFGERDILKGMHYDPFTPTLSETRQRLEKLLV